MDIIALDAHKRYRQVCGLIEFGGPPTNLRQDYDRQAVQGAKTYLERYAQHTLRKLILNDH